MLKEIDMPLQIVGHQAQIVDAINRFPADYHCDYFRVRELSRTYLGGPAFPVTANPLALELRNVLGNWRVGRRKAPPVLQTFARFNTALLDPTLHNLLVSLGATPLTILGLLGGNRRAVNGIANPITPAEFDHNLMTALGLLSRGLFVGNTNVTYPMKALLLITGLMPAFDSQVRKGLELGGLRGINKTQFLLPQNPSGADGMKITRLPFLLGQCWTANAEILAEAMANSLYPALGGEPGRLFDILLFMQAKMHQIILSYQSARADWYNLH